MQELNRLAHTLLVTNSQSPEAWVALAFLSEKKGRRESAHTFVNKAAELDPYMSRALVLKGQLLNADQKFGMAITSYRKAYQLSRDLSVYQVIASHSKIDTDSSAHNDTRAVQLHRGTARHRHRHRHRLPHARKHPRARAHKGGILLCFSALICVVRTRGRIATQ